MYAPVQEEPLPAPEYAPAPVEQEVYAPVQEDPLPAPEYAPAPVEQEVYAPAQDPLPAPEYAPASVEQEVFAPAQDPLPAPEYTPAAVEQEVFAPAQDPLPAPEYEAVEEEVAVQEDPVSAPEYEEPASLVYEPVPVEEPVFVEPFESLTSVQDAIQEQQEAIQAAFEEPTPIEVAPTPEEPEQQQVAVFFSAPAQQVVETGDVEEEYLPPYSSSAT